MPLSGEFHVVVTNTSNVPVKILSQSCVEGRRQLLFEFIDGGYCWTVCRKIENVRRNIRTLETLEPGEPMVIHVDLSSAAWDHPVPLNELKGRTLKVRAVFIGGAGLLTNVAHIKGAVDPSGKSVDPGPQPEPAPRPKSEATGTDAWAGTAVSAVERTYTLD